MRPNQNKNRQRNRNGGRKHVNPLSRNYESTGPDVKVRGNAAHVAEKYMQLARDAQSSGDSVMAENYLQHAEHYFRIVSSAQQALNGTRDDENEFDDDVSEMNSRFSSPQPVQPQASHEAEDENAAPGQSERPQSERPQSERPQSRRPVRVEQPVVAETSDAVAETGEVSAEPAASEEEQAAPRKPRERRPRRRRPAGDGTADLAGADQPDIGEQLPAFLTAGPTPNAAE